MSDILLPFLGKNISDLPTVLSGPLLRHTDFDRVSVWLAFREPVTDVELSIYDNYAGSKGSATLMFSGSTDYCVSLGDHLYVTLVTASTTDSGSYLVAGQRYHYDVGVTMDGGGTLYLNDAGLIVPEGSSELGGDILAYGTDDLPSFLAPVSDIDDLRIMHGSCRKPHGGTQDGLMALDVVLDFTHNYPEYRPQQLFLTGDQIYGDDVADVVAGLIQDTMPKILGWWEELPLITPENEELLGIGQRERLVVGEAGMTGYGAYSKSHSMRLGEYMGLYLLAWSDVLWPETLPEFADIDTASKRSVFDGERAAVEVYRETIQSVRRILANIPTYMMFDDHEVMDDWFLYREATKSTLDSELGSRIATNGLSAYAVFQGWGNTPDRYESGGAGRDILDQLSTINGNAGAILSDWNTLKSLVLPTLNEVSNDYAVLTGGMDWHYAHRFEKYMVVAINSRTARAYHGSYHRSSPALLSEDAILTQIQGPRTSIYDAETVEVTLLVAGAPVFGHPFIEEKVQPFMSSVLTNLHNAGLREEGGESYTDKEAWLFHRPTLENTLWELSLLKRVVILSGDVHYAFSSEIKYWNQRDGDTAELESRAAFVQLTSSALKNSDGKTNFMSATFPTDYEFLGWTDPNGYVIHRVGDGNYLLALAEPTVVETEEEDVVMMKPDWQYSVRFRGDARDDDDRGEPNWFAGVSGWVGPDYSWREGGSFDSPYNPNKVGAWMEALALNHDRRVVGMDNMGEVIFNWSADNKEVLHYLWSNPTISDAAMIPYTLHTLSLDIPDHTDVDHPRPIESLETDYVAP